MRKQVIHYGTSTNNSVLTTPTKLVEFLDKRIHLQIQQLHDVFTHCGKSAVGLASNQIGNDSRIFIYFDEQTSTNKIVINPMIVFGNDEVIEMEGCLSFPNMWTPVKRFKEIQVTYVDFLSLEDKIIEVNGFKSRLFQHEIEHLMGELFIQNLSGEEKDEFLARYARINRLTKDNARRYRSR